MQNQYMNGIVQMRNDAPGAGTSRAVTLPVFSQVNHGNHQQLIISRSNNNSDKLTIIAIPFHSVGLVIMLPVIS